MYIRGFAITLLAAASVATLTSASWWVETKAKLGNTAAQLEMAEEHYQNKEFSQCEDGCSRLAEEGNSQAQALLGRCLLEKKDYATALLWLNKAAAQGDVCAQTVLGQCYECGTGVVKNRTLAMFWYGEAAKKDFPWAQYELGKQYRYVNWFQRDLDKAAEWFRKAAEHDFAAAQYELGLLLEHPDVNYPKNKEEGVRLYRKAAIKGYSPACQRLKELGLQPSPPTG